MHKLSINSAPSKLISKKIGIFIADDLRPFSVVESKSFIDLVECLEPRYSMPSHPYFSDTVVPGLYGEVKARVISELEGAISVALTTDAWSSGATMSYVTVTAHFINERWTLEEHVLETHHVPESRTVTNLGDALYATAERWAIIRDHGIHAVVPDNASNVIEVVAPSGLDPHIGCFAHYLNLVALKALGTQVLSCLLGRVRRIISYFHRSNIASHTLEEKQAQLGLAPSVAKSKNLIIDVKTRWNSAFNLLVRYSELEMAVLAALASPEIKKQQTDVDTLNKTDINNLHKAIVVLQPLKTATVALCEAGVPTASMILPLLHTLMNAMEQKPNDPSMEKDIKSVLRKKLSQSYPNKPIKQLLKTITALDPRFRTLPFLTDDEKNEIFFSLPGDVEKYMQHHPVTPVVKN